MAEPWGTVTMYPTHNVHGASGAGDGGIPEAPMDGVVYGRQDGAWVAIPGASVPFADVTGEWQVTAQTTSSDPGNGHVKFNTAAQGDATEIYLSEKSVGGLDMSNWLNQSPAKIFVQRKNDSTRLGRWNITSITDNTTWFVLTVTPEGTAAGFPMAGNDAVIILLRW